MIHLVECFRCEKKFEPGELVKDGGCVLCKKCQEYINRVWPEEMAKEYNNEPQKCKGCE